MWSVLCLLHEDGARYAHYGSSDWKNSELVLGTKWTVCKGARKTNNVTDNDNDDDRDENDDDDVNDDDDEVVDDDEDGDEGVKWWYW